MFHQNVGQGTAGEAAAMRRGIAGLHAEGAQADPDRTPRGNCKLDAEMFR